ncbi:MAG: hypothetical protein HC853_14140 [Anaerolineae bacterium]|nr:hypothetical protein [Anaerolineae bacterium]
MSNRHKFAFAFTALSLLMALAASHSPAQPAQATPPQQPLSAARVLVDASDPEAIAQLQTSGATLLADYGAFSLWQIVAPSRAPELANRPSVAAISDFSKIYLRDGNVIDTGASNAGAPASVTNELGLQTLSPAPQLQQPQPCTAILAGPIRRPGEG